MYMLPLSQSRKLFCCLEFQDFDGDFASTMEMAEQAASGADSISCREIAQPLKVNHFLFESARCSNATGQLKHHITDSPSPYITCGASLLNSLMGPFAAWLPECVGLLPSKIGSIVTLTSPSPCVCMCTPCRMWYMSNHLSD